MTAGKQYFLDGKRHPLNERIPVSVDGTDFVIAHPPVVDVSQAQAFFNHDQFQGVVATSTGARALVIEMVHTEEFEGPGAFHLVDHDWTSDARKKLSCTGLKLAQ